MKRSHDSRETIRLLSSIRKEIPDAAIRTTLIAGHPGESEDDYKMLRDFVQEFRFDRLGVFAYSHEEDTYAYRHYKDEIPRGNERGQGRRTNGNTTGHLIRS